MASILIVDDEESICWGLSRLLRGEGHAVTAVSSAEEAILKIASTPPDLVVLDVRLPGMDGLTAMSRFRELAGPVPIIVITAFGSLNTAVAALGDGAFDYLPKPFDLDQAAAVIDRALAASQPDAADSIAALPDEVEGELVGTSPAMQEVFKRIALVAHSDTAVLISGESGTGKELVARAIHRHSRRANAPLLPVNLASLSPTLIESELFGHVRGAFTGAETARRGLLELADGATVFFDEAGDIPPNMQVKLLRVLEQQEVTPVGDTRPRPTRFRVIAATNRDLRRECETGRFRQDLFFRLAVFEVHLPPLRERREDIPLLAELFLKRWASRKTPPRILPETLRELARRDWPGNVRELRNAIEHGALVARTGAIGPEHLPPAAVLDEAQAQDPTSTLRAGVRKWAVEHLNAAEGTGALYERFLSAVEPSLFEAALEAADRNRARAAELLGIHRATLRKKLNR